MQVKAIAKTIGNFLHKNSPYILTGLGCAGVVSTAVMTGKAAVKASRVIDDAHVQKGLETPSEETPTPLDLKEKVRLTWRYFIPPAIMGATSVACVICAQSVNTKRHAALASLYTLTDQTLKDYQEKVIETIGKNKEQKIKDEMAQDILDRRPVSMTEVIRTGQGETLCYDSYSGRYFMHDIEKLRKIQNDFNHDLIGDMWLPLNELYYKMGLEEVKMGEDLGWTVDELLDFVFTSRLTDDGRPCLVIDYDLTARNFKRSGSLWG